jgi:AraC family transcriptional regulator, transcriptional activator of pobA
MSRPKRPRAPQVPIFTLYGEPDAISDLEFVHIEHIATRSQRYGWEIDSHAHRGLFQMLCLFGGGATVRLDDAAFEMRPPAAIVIPPAAVHAFQFLPGTQGYVLTVAESLLTGADAVQGALFEPLLAGPQLADLGREEGAAQRVGALLEQIFDEFRWPRGGRDQMFDWLVRAVLLLVARQLSAAPLAGGVRGRADLFARFRGLVEAHFTEHWPVPRYAAALNVTESRLNRLCQALAGKSAFDVVQDRLLLEARRKLHYIAAPVSQLAYELGFADPAYFCRFFKKRTGVAPSTFRRQRGEG